MADLPRGEVVEPVEVPSSLRADTLTGRFVTLRRPVATDAAPLYRSTHGDQEREAVWAYLGYGPWPGLDQFQRWLVERLDSTDPLWFTVSSNETSQPIGMVTILNADLSNRRLELGHIWYIPEAQRTAANTEATYLLLAESFDHYHTRRVEWKCDSMNEKSRKAALRLGFSFEGIFRNHMIVKGRNRDTAWFSITDHEWPKVKKDLEDRLYGG
ncbi:MAG TPA: GNAT family protein [Acidimicrobiia bacterium]|nr:GNAT family protein [Acidimicrobiia bacterium]